MPIDLLIVLSEKKFPIILKNQAFFEKIRSLKSSGFIHADVPGNDSDAPAFIFEITPLGQIAATIGEDPTKDD